MTRILVCADGFFRSFSPIALEPYIEMFINSLADNGNDVMLYVAKDIIKNSQKVKNWYRKFCAYQDVKKFNPEIIFSFNNVNDERFLKNFDCPCYIIASDTPKFWHKLDLITKYRNKYRILYFNNDFKDILKNTYKIGYDEQFLIPYTTEIKALNLEQNLDISFIGNFNNPVCGKILQTIFQDKNKNTEKENLIKEILYRYEKDGCISDTLYKEYSRQYDNYIEKEEFESILCIAFTNNIRSNFLNALIDLDLNIYTFDANLSVLNYNYNIFRKCHFQRICSSSDNEQIYNKSKISLTLPHFQAKTGFSWRVCDIMASNAMLLSNSIKDIEDLFGGIVPTYSNEKDLHDKCVYYLRHEDERREIVTKSQEIINKNHRFINLLQKIEEYTGIKLIHPNKKGSIKNIRRTQRLQARYYRKNGLTVNNPSTR